MQRCEYHLINFSISIHAPTRGATYNCRHSHGPWHFNPRSYKRSDAYYVDPSDGDFISIHAPTRGATVIILKDLVMYQFQSTLLQEERHSQMYFLYSGMNFNPRSYKRSDPAACPLCCIPDIFQSTLLQEERPFLGIFAPDCCQFQSTLLQEERR